MPSSRFVLTQSWELLDYKRDETTVCQNLMATSLRAQSEIMITCSSLTEHFHVSIVRKWRLVGIVIHCNTRNRIPLGYNNIP